jgi:ribonuclease/clavin/mitogillin
MSLFEKPPAEPRDAAAMVLLRDPEDPKVLWVRRARTLAFMAGYHAFPGGQRDLEDETVPILSNPPSAPMTEAPGSEVEDRQDLPLRVTAIRELFEETGILVARGVERLSADRLAALRQELLAGATSFGDLLTREGVFLDAGMVDRAPRWVTPPSQPRRYDTRFYVAWLPAGQEAQILPGELESGEWIRPSEGLCRWVDGECLLVTPITAMLQALTEGITGVTQRLHRLAQTDRDHLEMRVEMRYGVYLCPLRTPTIPPATHTNCYLIGGDELVIIDPGSPYPDQQQRLDAVLDRFLREGRRFREILITHLHPDHIGGVQHVATRYQIPVAAHRLTAEAISGDVRVDRWIEDNEILELREARSGLSWSLRALWTPGHARGHLSFYEERTGTLLTGDCVVGSGTVVVAPPEGKMTDYLASLQRYLTLPRLTALLPGHGPVIANARERIEEYLQHRTEREAQIIARLDGGERTIPCLVKEIYQTVPSSLHTLAELTVLAHLEKLEEEGVVVRNGQVFSLKRNFSAG